MSEFIDPQIPNEPFFIEYSDGVSLRGPFDPTDFLPLETDPTILLCQDGGSPMYLRCTLVDGDRRFILDGGEEGYVWVRFRPVASIAPGEYTNMGADE